MLPTASDWSESVLRSIPRTEKAPSRTREEYFQSVGQPRRGRCLVESLEVRDQRSVRRAGQKINVGPANKRLEEGGF